MNESKPKSRGTSRRPSPDHRIIAVHQRAPRITAVAIQRHQNEPLKGFPIAGNVTKVADCRSSLRHCHTTALETAIAITKHAPLNRLRDCDSCDERHDYRQPESDEEVQVKKQLPARLIRGFALSGWRAGSSRKSLWAASPEEGQQYDQKQQADNRCKGSPGTWVACKSQ